MSDSLLYQLVLKKISGTATPRESALLHVYAAFSTDDALTAALTRAWEDHETQHHLTAQEAATMFSEILASAPPEKRRITWIQWCYRAAAVVLLTGGAFWLWQHHFQPIPAKIVAGIEPGHRGAILTLSDGKVVNLDTLQNGQVATQGSTKISIHENNLVYDGNQATGEISYNTLSTPKGRQFSLMLPDGTKVWLNAASSLTYPTAFTGNERRIKVSGEAYFEVTTDAHKPFYLEVDPIGRIQVLGTSFAINTHGDNGNYAATLFDGKISVETEAQRLILRPGQQAVVHQNMDGKRHLALVAEPDLEQVLAWQNGIFNFRHASLNSVLQQLGRWYDLEIVYEGKPPQRVFGGEITMDLQLKQALSILEDMGVTYRLEGRKLIISEKTQQTKTNY